MVFVKKHNVLTNLKVFLETMGKVACQQLAGLSLALFSFYFKLIQAKSDQTHWLFSSFRLETAETELIVSFRWLVHRNFKFPA